MKLDFRETSKRWMGYGEDYFKEARDLFIKIVFNLITLETFVLGFVVIFVQIAGIENLVKTEKVIFLIGSSFGILSIFLGAWSLFETNKFLNKAGENYQEKSTKLAKYIMDTGKDNDEDYPDYLWENIKEKYSLLPWQVISQIIAFTLGIALSIIFILLVIF